ncbi:hypothetical protein KM043_016202 [Ampulex compressa]|nr:hypothetical protein KM043_016202 [Ampulex compressa]
MNLNVKNNFDSKMNSAVTESDSQTIVSDVKFSSSPLQEEKKGSKRKRQDAAKLENKRLAEEEYNKQIHEQRYKRLMHLLNRSQFYSSYLIDKINGTPKKETSRTKRGEKNKIQVVDENMPPVTKAKQAKRLGQEYDIREYISSDVKKVLNSKKEKLNLSEEEIREELYTDSEPDPKNATEVIVEVPKYFNGSLRDYQLEGLQWLKVLYENGINGILADEMGLGKTVQVIALLCHLFEKHQDGPYLIIAPLSTIPNWMMELEKFAPKLPLVLLYGSADERAAMYKKIKMKYNITPTYKTQPIVLTTYEIPLYEKNFLKTQNWRYIIIDEGHRIKNQNCQLLKVLKTLNSMNRLLLTGTPLHNNLAELWSLLNFLLPEIFDDLAIFESWFDAKDLQYDKGAEKLLKLEEEKHVLHTLQLQHDLYKAVLNRDIQTLSKINETLIIEDENGVKPKRRCVLKSKYNLENMSNQYDEEVKNSYTKPHEYNENDQRFGSTNYDIEKQSKSMQEKNLSIWTQYTNVTERNRDFLIRIHFSNRISMYKKIVNHPYLVHCPLDSVGLPKIDADLIKSSGKLLVLDAMLARLKMQGHKVLVFSTMTMILDMLEDYLAMRDYRYVRLDGDVKIEQRKECIKNFNADSEIFLFLISTRAGGVGLNLAAADTVILYDSDWNPQADIQAMARCHRIGQTRPVVIYRLCTKGTIDEAIIQRAEAKRILEKMVISKNMRTLNLNNKTTLIELKMLLESKESEVVSSEKEVFTEAELNKLMDRTDMMCTDSNNPAK